MKKYIYWIIPVLLLIITSCKNESLREENPEAYGNPAAEGFDLEGSDPEAIELADQVMEAMGGRQAWDHTRYIKWNFFGARRHIWDKQTGDVHIEGIRDTFEIRMNINDMNGMVNYHGRQLTRQDSLVKYLQRGKEMWINDSYWLVMPYKLKDSGVTLKNIGRDTMVNGSPAEVLSLTFKEVGVTPNNKYHVYVDPEDSLVKQWDYFPNALDSVPRFQIPWENWQKYGEILLSGDRGGNRKLTEIAVGDSLAIYLK